MIILILYLLFFFVIGIIDYYRVKNFDDYIVAGRKQKESLVTMSILATVIGASATMGIASLAVQYGSTAFLWLGSGGIALILQSLLLSKKIRSFNAYTLPGIADITAGKEGKIIISLVIIISWTGIIAAQFVALSSIVALLTGKQTTTIFIIACSLVVIFYTAFGGQISIIRTDAIQLLFVATGIALALFALFRGTDININQIFTYKSINDVSFVKILHLIFIVGGSYFIGPDIFSRNFTSESEITAKKATFKAGIALLIFSIAVTMTGIITALVNPQAKENPFIYIIKYMANPVTGIIIALGLLSAIISSTDTCIVTVSAIIEKDIFGKTRLYAARIIVVIVGLLSLLLALFKKDILALLTGTYSIFSPGVVFPVFIAITAKNKHNINKNIWLSAVLTGGAFGLLSNITGKEYISLIGMAFSVILSILSIYCVKREIAEKQ